MLAGVHTPAPRSPPPHAHTDTHTQHCRIFLPKTPFPREHFSRALFLSPCLPCPQLLLLLRVGICPPDWTVMPGLKNRPRGGWGRVWGQGGQEESRGGGHSPHPDRDRRVAGGPGTEAGPAQQAATVLVEEGTDRAWEEQSGAAEGKWGGNELFPQPPGPGQAPCVCPGVCGRVGQLVPGAGLCVG